MQGHILWDSSYIMGNWLAIYGSRLWQVGDYRQVPSVVELGAGLGLCSLVRVNQFAQHGAASTGPRDSCQ